MRFDILYIFLSLVVGSIICYEDLKKGLIRNKFLLLLFLIGLGYFLFNFKNLDLRSFVICMGSSIFLGIFLWLIDIWPAADGKFFIILSFVLFPILNSSLISYALIINTCVPFFFLYSLFAIIKSGRKKIKESLKYAFNPYRVFMITIVLLGFVGFITDFLSFLGIFYYFGIIGSIFITIILLFFAIDVLTRILSFNLEPFFVICAILRLILAYQTIYTLNFGIYFVSMVLIFLLFRFFILKLTFDLVTHSVKITKLKPGMKLAEGIFEKDGHYGKVRFLHTSFIDFMSHKLQKFVHETGEEGLTKDDIKKIKKLYRERKLSFDRVLVYETFSLAIFLFIGFILTLLLRMDVISFIRYLF